MSESLGSRLGTSQTQDLVLLAGLGLAAYVLYKIFGAAQTVAQGAAAVGQGAANIYNQTSELLDTSPDPNAATWASWYDPTQRSVFVFVLTFPDGSHGVVWGSSVQPDGTFTSSGNLYRIGNDKSGGLRAYDYSPVLGDGAPAITTPLPTDFGVTNTQSW